MKIKDYVRYSMQLAHIGPRKTHSTNAKNYVLRPVPAIYLPPQLNHPMSLYQWNSHCGCPKNSDWVSDTPTILVYFMIVISFNQSINQSIN